MVDQLKVPRKRRPASTVLGAALIVLGALVMAATLTAFLESYDGLYHWALGHRLHSGWARAWPLQVDAFIAAGELALLLSALHLWPRRVRVLAWSVSGIGLAASIACNAGHVGRTADLADHLTAALPPVAAMAGLVVALSVVKQLTGSQTPELPDRNVTPIPAFALAPVKLRPYMTTTAMTVYPTPVTPGLRDSDPFAQAATDADRIRIAINTLGTAVPPATIQDLLKTKGHDVSRENIRTVLRRERLRTSDGPAVACLTKQTS